MKRRNFIKGMFGAIAAAVVPVSIVEAKLTSNFVRLPAGIRWSSLGESPLIIGTQDGYRAFVNDVEVPIDQVTDKGVIKLADNVPPASVIRIEAPYHRMKTRKRIKDKYTGARVSYQETIL